MDRVVVLLLVILQVWRCHCNYTEIQDALNHQAARITCSGYAPLPSKVVVTTQLHPLKAILVLRPLCAGGPDAHQSDYGLPAVISVFYTGNHIDVCLFNVNNDTYSIDIEVLAHGTHPAGILTMSCPLPITSTQLDDRPVAPYQHVLRSGDLPSDRANILCNIDLSVNVTFLPQPHKTYIFVSCSEISLILTMEDQPLMTYVSFEHDPFQHCVYKTDIAATRMDPNAADNDTITGVEVAFFNSSTLVEEGQWVIVPCTPPPVIIHARTTESFHEENLITVPPPPLSTIPTSTVAPVAAVSLISLDALSTTPPSSATSSGEDSRLEITADCGNSTSSSAWISATAGDTAHFVAVCKSGHRFIFGKVTNQEANFFLPVLYDGDDSSYCVFNRRVRSDVYAISVLVSWEDNSQSVYAFQREYQVSCIFGPKAEDDSAVHRVLAPLVAPKVFQHHMGPVSQSSVSVDMVDIFGTPLNELSLGRQVYLTAHSDGLGGEVGLQVVGCDAVGTQSNARYAIIRNGCGDGIVFPKNKGFTTVGLHSRSPYFQAFTLYNNDEISFRCNFTMCSTNCDGSSCGNDERRRRRISWTDLQLLDGHYFAWSKTFGLNLL